jgi:tetratricopeptide (TPR) repeat protein
MLPCRMLRATLFVGMMLGAGTLSVSVAQEISDDEAKERAIVDRFVSVLEKNPRRGTAFDKVYGHHLERGSLGDLIQHYRDAATQTNAASDWMIVGLLESKRGRDAEAREAFANAESLDPANSLAAFYLGQSLVYSGQSDPAAEAFERAIARKPAPADLLDMFQSLGRVYLRAGRTDKALGVWTRLEEQFPNDARVQEQIAATLVEENDFDAALPRYERLALSTTDKSRRSQFQVEAAEIKARLGRTDEALRDFEALLGQLNPDNWLFRDVRQRIERIFLRTDDHGGLIKYYERWLAKSPEDLEAMSRVAKLLASVGRARDARVWLERGLKLAPSKKELRQALISQYLYGQNFADAIRQYEQLDKFEPNNPDVLREWGRVILKDTSRDIDTRRADAAAVWRRLLAARPDDAVVASQTADLFRRAEMADDALALYRRAVELAPDAVQYREYLGEYLHSLDRKDEALAVWREIAAGSRRTAPNVARLAEVLAGFGHLDEAIATSVEACTRDSKNFHLQLKHADLLSRADRHDDSLKQLAVAEKLAAADEEREAILRRELSELQSLDRLKSRIVELLHELESTADQPVAAPQVTAGRWYWLARAEEVDRQSRAAAQAIAKATELAPQSIPYLVASARIHESQHKLAAAVEINRRLAVVDRRSRSEYLKNIAILEQKLGHDEDALRAGRELMAAAPGNPELFGFFADLCFRLRQTDEGIQALRLALRANPGDIATLLKLATALAEKKQIPESIELLWRAFERSQSLEERLTIVEKLAEAHGKTSQINRLYIRLERERRNPSQSREMTLCLAEAYLIAGDIATAQRKLESLYTEETRDTSLLIQLRKLAEKQNDMPAAVRYQRRLWQVTGDKSDRAYLGQLLMTSGDIDGALELYAPEKDSPVLTAEFLRMLDTLHRAGMLEAMAAKIKPLRERFPDNWELLYREGMVLTRLDPTKAASRFEAIIAANIPDDDPSKLRSSGISTSGIVGSTASPLPLVERLGVIQQVQVAIAMNASLPQTFQTQSGRASGQIRMQQARFSPWYPASFGEARIASFGWLLNSKRRDGAGAHAQFAEDLIKKQNPSESRQGLIDEIAIRAFGNDFRSEYEAVRRLAVLDPDDIEARVQCLIVLNHRATATAQAVALGVQQTTKPPSVLLDVEEVNEAVVMYRQVAERADLGSLAVSLLGGVVTELNARNQPKLAQELVEDAASHVRSKIEVAHLLHRICEKSRPALTIRLLDRLIEFQGQPATTAASFAGVPNQLNQQMSLYILSPQNIGTLLRSVVQRSSASESLDLWRRYQTLLTLDVASRGSQNQSMNPRGGQFTVVTLANGQTAFARLGNVSFSQSGSAMPGVILDSIAVDLLSHVHARFKAESRVDELTAALEKEARSADHTPDEQLLWQHAQALAMWIDHRFDAALAVLESAMNQRPERNDLRLGLAQQFELAKEPTEGLRILDTVKSSTLDEERDVERMVLRMAIEAEKTERAKQAARRMIDLGVLDHERLSLAEQLVELGMTEQAETLLERKEPAGVYNIAAQKVLMDIQLARGKNDEASTTAKAMLDVLDRFPAAAMRQSGNRNVQQQLVNVNGRMVVTLVASQNAIDPAALRQHAYKILRQTGKLAEMIDEAEKQFEANPLDEKSLRKLITFHTAAGNKPRIDELTVDLLKLEADKPPNRFALAIKLLEQSKSDEALEHMKILLKRDPDYFATRCRETLFRFDGRKELPEFAGLLEQLDWGTDHKQLGELPSIINQLSARPGTVDIGQRLFLKTWKEHPERHIALLQRFPDERWWELKEVRADLRSLVIPQDGPKPERGWSLFGRVLFQDDVNRKVVTLLNRILDIEQSQQQLDPLAADLDRLLKLSPDWIEGRVLLALVDLRRDRSEDGIQVLDGLYPRMESICKNDSQTAREIAQELARSKDGVDVAAKYYKLAIRESGMSVWMTGSYAANELIDAFERHGRRGDSMKILLESVPESLRSDRTESDSLTSRDLAIVTSVARKMRSIGGTVEAIDLCVAALDRSATMATSGYDPRTELHSSLVAAFGDLKPEEFVRHVESRSDDSHATSLWPFDLHVFVRNARSSPGDLQSRWSSTIHQVAGEPELGRRLLTTLQKIHQQHEDDITPLIVTVLVTGSNASPAELQSAIQRLSRFVATHPLDPIPEAADKSAAARRTAMKQVALWLVARRCLNDKTLAADGTRLAERALLAARQQTTSTFAVAIAEEWSALAKQNGDAARVEQLDQLLKETLDR